MTSHDWSEVLQKHEGWEDVFSPTLPTGQGSKDFGPKHQAGAAGPWASPSRGPPPVLSLWTAGRSHPVPPRPRVLRDPSVDLPFPGSSAGAWIVTLTAGHVLTGDAARPHPRRPGHRILGPVTLFCVNTGFWSRQVQVLSRSPSAWLEKGLVWGGVQPPGSLAQTLQAALNGSSLCFSPE